MKFDDRAQILSAHLYELNPPNLDVSIRMNEAENGIIFSPFLLNKGESIPFQILVDNPVVFRGFTQRIVGITKIRYKSVVPFPGMTKWDWLSGLLALIGAAVFILLGDTGVIMSSVPVVIIAIAGMFGMLVIIFRLDVLVVRSVVLLIRSIASKSAFD